MTAFTAVVLALLALLRVGRREVQRRPVDLGELARSAFAEIHAATPDRIIELAIGATSAFTLGGELRA